jgi:hypothetical protein
MTAMEIFVTELVITIGIVFLTGLYLERPLRASLANQPGTTSRMKFWLAFFHVVLVLVPCALILGEHPAEDNLRGAVFQITSQVEPALIGLSITILIAVVVLAKYAIRTQSPLSALRDAENREN